MGAFNSLISTNLISWIILGIVAGTVIHIMDTKKSRGIVGSLISGVLGAIIGGVFANLIFGFGITGFSILSLVVALISAFAISSIQRLVKPTNYERGVDPRSLGSRDLPLDYNPAYYSQVAPIGGNIEGAKNSNRQLTKNWLKEFFDSLNYPISKRDLIRVAEDKDAKRGTLSLLENLPDHIYDNEEQLAKELEKLD